MKLVIADFKTLIIVGSIILTTIIIYIMLNIFFRRYYKRLLRKTDHDITGFLFFKRIVLGLTVIMGIAFALVQIPEFKIVGHSLLAGAGVISIIVGIASQQSLGNMISGILIVVFKPFKIRDRISLRGNLTGIVEDINLRQVVIRDFENNRRIIPNSVISSEIIVNSDLMDSKCCKHVEIGIGYSSDIERALKIMKEEMIKHPLHIDNRTPQEIENNVPFPVARVIGLGDSSVNLRLWAWAENTANGFVLYCDLIQSIKKRFDAENIEIPFPKRSVTITRDQGVVY
jgi:small conductance mechanosensitive channel